MWKREDRRQTSETLYTVYYCIWSEEYTVYNQNKVIQLSMLTANEHYRKFRHGLTETRNNVALWETQQGFGLLDWRRCTWQDRTEDRKRHQDRTRTKDKWHNREDITTHSETWHQVGQRNERDRKRQHFESLVFIMLCMCGLLHLFILFGLTETRSINTR